MKYDPKLERACFYWPEREDPDDIYGGVNPILAKDEFESATITGGETSWDDVDLLREPHPPGHGLWVFEGVYVEDIEGGYADDEVSGSYRRLYAEERVALDEGRLALFWAKLRKKAAATGVV